jgi:outer membrane immunogenic protein
MTMKKALVASVGLLAASFAAPAIAAELPARIYTKASPVIAAVYDWSGFSIGANAGGGWTKDTWTSSVAGTDWGSHTASGAVAGGQVGYRWQAASWVLGLEAQGNWADISGSATKSWAVTLQAPN